MPPPPIPQGKPPLPQGGGPQQFQPLSFKPFKAPDGEFDGKRLRKSVMRKTVDYNCSVVNMLENRVWQRDERDRSTLQADVCYASEMLPPTAYPVNPINAVVTKFVRTSTNKAKCPIFCLAWTPEGRRLVTGASSGEFTLWNGLTFNFETILQAHDSSVRTMVWSHNDQWMVTGDTGGFVKYWQTNMNNVKLFQAHKDPVRGLRYSLSISLHHRPFPMIICSSCPINSFKNLPYKRSFIIRCSCSFLHTQVSAFSQSSTHLAFRNFPNLIQCHIGIWFFFVFSLCYGWDELPLDLIFYNILSLKVYENLHLIISIFHTSFLTTLKYILSLAWVIHQSLYFHLYGCLFLFYILYFMCRVVYSLFITCLN